jgi:hypothetical protein
MGQSSCASVHTFHIPVMGTGFTIDTPLKVAHFGISSVVSLADDTLVEQMRRRLSRDHGEPCEPIEDHEADARARRITAYLDLLDTLVQRRVADVRHAAFAAGSEIVRYFEMLPPSPLRDLYEAMQRAADPETRRGLQERLRGFVAPGAIDVNIMTKLDRDHDRQGRRLPARCSDALSALRGFMNSRIDASVILSAGMNRRLFSYLAEFGDAFPDERGDLRKRIVLKVSDYRSALVQGKLLAKLGLHVAEFRVESGLNCGGHAFGGKGQLMGPILEEFRREKANLAENLRQLRRQALSALGRSEPACEPAPARITVQGGIGNADEDRLLRDHYGVDGTGWGSAFLFVPEVVNIDRDHLQRLLDAGEHDIQLSEASPLGVPFWLLRSSTSEEGRRRRISAGKPGSSCPKGHLVSSSEFTATPICTASRAFQRRKLEQIEGSGRSAAEAGRAREMVLAKSCLCQDLAGSATVPTGIDPTAATTVCCGPNAAYFGQETSLAGMVDHIYGRAALPLAPGRPHMLLKELALNLDRLRLDIARHDADPAAIPIRALAECRKALQQGVRHYLGLVGTIAAPQREAFRLGLEGLQQELVGLAPVCEVGAE